MTSHPRVEGADPYGLAIVFNIACAGHVELVTRDSQNPQAVPFGCFDENHTQLQPDQYVIGLSRVYGYDTRRNANPTISGVFQDGRQIDETVGFVVDRCTTRLRSDCPEIKFDVAVPPADQELQEGDQDPDGNVRREQIWAAYYSDVGQFDSEIRLLYDPSSGKVDDTANKYQAANQAGDTTMFIVVHDNRGGAVWKQLAVHTREPAAPQP